MSILDSIAGAAGAAAGGAGTPLTALSTVVEKALSFIPNPQDKIALQSHALDVQADLQKAQLEAETRQIEANKDAQGDHYLGKVRGGFCWMVIALMAWNYGLVYVFDWAFKASVQHIELPLSLLGMFGTIMLGYIGIPAGLEAVKQILAMPGDSSVKLPGLSAKNKS